MIFFHQDGEEGNVTVLSESTLPVMTFDNGQLKDLLVKGGQIVIQDGGSLNSSTISFTTRLENCPFSKCSDILAYIYARP